MANWIINQPQIIAKERTQAGDLIVAKVRVRFVDDSVPQNSVEKDFILSGQNILAQLARLVYDTQQELQAADAIAVGEITPEAPPAITPRTQAEKDYIEAVNNLSALQYLKTLGLANVAGQTIDTVLANRRTAIENMVDTVQKLTVALPLTPVR